MSLMRVGVIGVGHLGYHHARNYLGLEGVELVGVVDSDAEKRARAESDFGVTAFARVEDLLAAGVGAVSVVTPTVAHHAVTMQVLGAGAHVLVEKPIATTLDEAHAMAAKAREVERILQVGHIERFNGAVMALFDAIKAPRFIECHRLSPYPMRSSDISVVHDLMIHDLDIVLTLDKSEVVSLDAVGVPVFSVQEDIANVRLRFASGCVANLTASRVSLEKMRKIRIFEANAYVSTDYSAQEVVVYRKKAGAMAADANPMEQIEIEPLEVCKDEPLRAELAHFVDCARRGASPAVTAEDGIRALELAEQITAFIRSHS